MHECVGIFSNFFSKPFRARHRILDGFLKENTQRQRSRVSIPLICRRILQAESWPCDLGVPDIPGGGSMYPYPAAALLGKASTGAMYPYPAATLLGKASQRHVPLPGSCSSG